MAQHEDVVDDVVRWRDLAVAAVPCELDEFEEVEGRICQRLAGNADDTFAPTRSSLRTADCHEPSLARPSSTRRLVLPNTSGSRRAAAAGT